MIGDDFELFYYLLLMLQHYTIDMRTGNNQFVVNIRLINHKYHSELVLLLCDRYVCNMKPINYDYTIV